MAQQSSAATVRFEATPQTIAGATILRLPATASKQLPSRGQVAVEGRINGRRFAAVIEPDGEFGHWLKVDAGLRKALGAKPAQPTTVELTPVKEWPEPAVPSDLQAALAAAPAKIRSLWNEITPMARWEWVRWVNATNNADTRARRVEVTISKMQSGKRRPCCFNLAACTDPQLARNGKLRDPA